MFKSLRSLKYSIKTNTYDIFVDRVWASLSVPQLRNLVAQLTCVTYLRTSRSPVLP